MITTFEMPTKIVFGAGAVAQLGVETRRFGKKAIIATYPDIRRIGLLDKVLADLKASGVESVIFDKVEPNPRSSTIDQGAALARSEKVDLVIGLGGGSAMDAAKGIATAITGTAPLWDYIERKAEMRPPLPAIIQVPTMAGTGAELSGIAVVTNWDTHVKSGLRSPLIQAQVAIIDPQITLTVPRNQTKAGAVDTFCHIVEAYVTDGTPSPLTDGIRETVMKMVVNYLPPVLAKLDDLEGRTQLSWASTVALSAYSRVGGGGGGLNLHGIEHALSGYYDVIHGEGLAALLPAWLKLILPDRRPRIELLGKNVFGKSDGIAATDEWLQSVDMRLRLRDIGCELERASEIADLAIKSSPNLAAGPNAIDAAVIAKLYRESY